MATAAQRAANARYEKTEKGREARKKVQQKYYKKNAEVIHLKRMKRVYGLEQGEYEQLIEDHDNACALCGKPQEDLARRLLVDHDHDTGRVRGLLCTPCNSATAQLGDNYEGIAKALDYMRDE